jgi:hypothetical protein
MSDYTPKFWNGYREKDVQKAMQMETPAAETFKKAVRDYYRLFNDGDTPHHARFASLCMKANMLRPVHLRDDPKTQDELIEALLDKVIQPVIEVYLDPETDEWTVMSDDFDDLSTFDRQEAIDEAEARAGEVGGIVAFI